MDCSDGVLEPMPCLPPPMGKTGVGLGLGDPLPTPQPDLGQGVEDDAAFACVFWSLGGFSSPGSWSHLPVTWPPPKELLKVILSSLCPGGDKAGQKGSERAGVGDIHVPIWNSMPWFSHQ